MLHGEINSFVPQGTRMDMGARIGDYTVTVGHKECAVTELYSDSLTFVPPVDEPDDDGLHSQDGGKIVRVSTS